LPCKFYNDDDHDTYPVVSVPGGNPCGHPDHRHHWRPPASSVYVSSGKQEQDARLMAAAPDLLDALQAVVAAFDADLHDLMIAKLAAMAAITRATGGGK
jgi:hypothetical protein